MLTAAYESGTMRTDKLSMDTLKWKSLENSSGRLFGVIA